MSPQKPTQLARVLKGRRGLLLSGALGQEVDFGGKKLVDYVADIARLANMPVAATGNTVVDLKARGVSATRKMWAAETVDFMRYPWKDPSMPQKPEMVVFMGYNPAVVRHLVTASAGVDTMVLGNTYVPEATYSLPQSPSLKQWQANLEELVQALGKDRRGRAAGRK